MTQAARSALAVRLGMRVVLAVGIIGLMCLSFWPDARTHTLPAPAEAQALNLRSRSAASRRTRALDVRRLRRLMRRREHHRYAKHDDARPADGIQPFRRETRARRRRGQPSAAIRHWISLRDVMSQLPCARPLRGAQVGDRSHRRRFSHYDNCGLIVANVDGSGRQAGRREGLSVSCRRGLWSRARHDRFLQLELARPCFTSLDFFISCQA